MGAPTVPDRPRLVLITRVFVFLRRPDGFSNISLNQTDRTPMGGSKTTSSNTIDPKLMALYQQNYNTALGVANRPYQPYTGEGVAPFAPAQLEAQGILGDVGRSNIGDAALASAIGGATGILGRVGANAPTLSGTDLSPYMN